MLVAHSGPTLCESMDCSPPGFSIHGILQASILEWVAIPFSRGSSQPRNQTRVSCFTGRFFTIWVTWEADTSTLQAYSHHTINILLAKASWIPVQHQEFRKYILPSMRGRGLWMFPAEESHGHSLPWSPLSQKLEWEYLLVNVILATVCPVAQQWRIYLQCRRHKGCGLDPWVRKLLWKREWQPTPVFLPGESHGQRSLVGHSPQDHKESDTTEATHTHWTHTHTHTHSSY